MYPIHTSVTQTGGHWNICTGHPKVCSNRLAHHRVCQKICSSILLQGKSQAYRVHDRTTATPQIRKNPIKKNACRQARKNSVVKANIGETCTRKSIPMNKTSISTFACICTRTLERMESKPAIQNKQQQHTLAKYERVRTSCTFFEEFI